MTQHFGRRRFMAISAGLAGLAALPARGAGLTVWRGIALGAEAQIRIAHPEADRLVEMARAEIARLEGVFSLFRTDSALSRLNAGASLADPPFELLECLALVGRVHRATGGLFDPTVQPLWALYARRFAAGRAPSCDDIARARALVGWSEVRFDASAVQLRPGMGLTLNGIAQGFIADRVTSLFQAQGLVDALVETGEFRALGGQPQGGPWQIGLASGGSVDLRDRALASSAALGTTFDAEGQVGHILNPLTGLPARAQWRLVTVMADSAALADALSTAACLMPDRASILQTIDQFPDARLAHLA